MSDYGVTADGFVKRRYNDIISDLNSRARAYFGDSVNVNENSPLGIIFKVVAWFFAKSWENAENVYYSSFVDTADGVNLDKVCKYIGITRLVPTAATGTVTVTGDASFTVPIGTTFGTVDGIEFETTEEVTLDGNGDGEIAVQATTTGSVTNVGAGEIIEIVSIVSELDTVTNAVATSNGRDLETDAELRDRYLVSVARGGSSTLDSIRAALLDEVEGVRAALVVENSSNTTDVDGRPPKSIECYLLGGDSADIAAVILDTKAAGIETYGSDSDTANDSAGNPHTIYFTYADEVDIYIDVTLTVNSAYPLDGDTLVKTAIIQYIGGTDEDGLLYSGLSMGDDVIVTRIVKAAMNATEGIEDVAVLLDITPSPAVSDNIPIDTTGVAQTDYTKVVINS